MTITKDANCEFVTVDSTFLVPTNQSVKLAIKINCGTEYLVTAEVEDTEIVVTPTTINLPDAETIPDGVYLFELTTVDEDGVVNIERKCTLINCTLSCLMVDSFKGMSTGDPEASIRSLAYYALLNSEGCSECSCDDLCTLYSATQLTQCSIYATGCGCS